MKYLLGFMLCFWSTLAFSQTDTFLEENDLVSYSIKKDSFTIFRDNDKTKDKKYIGLAIILNEKMGNQRIFQSTYKLLVQNCSSKKNTINLLRISDYDTIIHDSYDVDLSKKNLFTSIVENICDYYKEILIDPNKNKNSIQNLIEYASSTNEEDWTEILYEENDEITTLTKSIAIENEKLSIIARIRYPAKTTEYYKFYITRKSCLEKQGMIDMEPLAYDLNQEIYEEISFNNNKKANTIPEFYFNKMAKQMCSFK